MKKYLVATMTLVLALGLMQSIALAEKRAGHDHGMHHKKSVKDKFYKKVKMIYLYQDELGVTDKNLEAIKELKIVLKKDLIRKEAEIGVIEVEIRSLLREDEVNVKAVNKLIDRKSELKKANMKEVVKSYAQLKKILTKEQMDKLKDIAREQKKMHMMKSLMY